MYEFLRYFIIDFEQSKLKNEKKNDKDPFGDPRDANSFKLDLSHSIKSPFNGQNVHKNESKNTFSSKFVETDENYTDIREEVSKLTEEINKSKISTVSRSKSRKQWEKNGRQTDKSKGAMSGIGNKGVRSGSYTGEDSSFMEDFGDLMGEEKKVDKSVVEKSKERGSRMSNQTDFINPEIITKSPSGINFNWKTEAESYLQIIHSISCSLEDYFQD